MITLYFIARNFSLIILATLIKRDILCFIMDPGSSKAETYRHDSGLHTDMPKLFI